MTNLGESGPLNGNNTQEPEATPTRRDLLKTAWIIPTVITMGVAPGTGSGISGESPEDKNPPTEEKDKEKDKK